MMCFFSKCKTVVAIVALCVPLMSFASGFSNSENVKKFVEAYNHKELSAMLALVNDDIQWLSVSGDNIVAETQDKEALKAAMSDYFSAASESRSEIRHMHTSGDYVYALEEAFWESNNQVKSQCSMAVYSFSAGKISKVWYFPSHKCDN